MGRVKKEVPDTNNIQAIVNTIAYAENNITI